MNCTPHCFSGRTRHFSDRCRQRRIEDFEVDLALLFGVSKGDRNELGKKSCGTLIGAVDAWIRHFELGVVDDGVNLTDAVKAQV